MTQEELVALRAEIESLPQLFSARHHRDLITIANELNMSRDAASAVDVATVLAALEVVAQ